MKKGQYFTKEAYVVAALKVVKTKGVDKLTLRSVAQELQVSHMAVYKHFANKEALMSATLDEFIAQANVIPNQKLHWDKWMNHMAHSMYHALSQHASWLPYLGSFSVGSNALKVTESFLNKLMSGGFTFEQALQAYLSMLHLIVGALTIEKSLLKSRENGVESIPSELLSVASQRDVNKSSKTITGNQLAISLPKLIAALKNELSG